MLKEQANLLTEEEKQLVNNVDGRDSLLEDSSIQEEINIRYNEYILSGASVEEASELSFMDNIDAFEVEYSEKEKNSYCKHIIIRNVFNSLGPYYEFDYD